MDQPYSKTTPHKILILSPPRTGSTTLCHLMLDAGLGMPHEYFNELNVRPLLQRFGLPALGHVSRVSTDIMLRYLQCLYAVRSRDGLFVAKIQHKQYRLFLQKHIELPLFANAKLIYLTRQDVLAQAVSWHFAEVTGRWGFERHALTAPKTDQDLFDVPAITTYVDEILAEQVLWEYFFQRHRLLPLRLTYEELQQLPSRVVDKVAAFAGRKAAAIALTADEQRPYEPTPGLPTKQAVIAHVRRHWSDRLWELPAAPEPKAVLHRRDEAMHPFAG
jgi:LPS sulfotransferase NodH